jgi:hypothetical protein
MQSFLSLTDGTPISIIKGGALDKKIVFITEKKASSSKIDDPLDILGEDFMYFNRKDGKNGPEKLSMKDMKIIERFLKSKTQKTLPKSHKSLFEKAKQILNDADGKRIKLDDNSRFQVLPNIDKERDAIYVSGMSGAGKSTWIANWIMEYKKLYPEREVWLFSRKKEDPVLDKAGVNRIPIDDELLEEPHLGMEEFKQSLVIFDDCDICDKKYKDVLIKLRDEILEGGRSINVSCIITSHLTTDFSRTRTVINECSSYVLFPHASSNKNNLNRFFKVYCGLDPAQIKKIYDLPSRWVCIHNQYPKYIASETEIYVD